MQGMEGNRLSTLIRLAPQSHLLASPLAICTPPPPLSLLACCVRGEAASQRLLKSALLVKYYGTLGTACHSQSCKRRRGQTCMVWRNCSVALYTTPPLSCRLGLPVSSCLLKLAPLAWRTHHLRWIGKYNGTQCRFIHVRYLGGADEDGHTCLQVM
jgi:hypothetical protein